MSDSELAVIVMIVPGIERLSRNIACMILMHEERAVTAPLNTPIYLKARETLRITDGEGLEVKCVCGSLWITQDSDHQDRVVADGGSFVLDRPGLSLVTALNGPALLLVQPTAAVAPRRLRSAA